MSRLPFPIARPTFAHVRLWLGATGLFFVLAATTIALTSDGRSIAYLWPANAALAAMLLADRQPKWGSVLSAGLIGNVLANLVTRGGLLGPAIYSVANLAEVAMVVCALRGRVGDDGLLSSFGAAVRFLLVAGVAAPIFGGLLGALAAAAFFAQPFGEAFATWVLADGLGLVTFTPLFLAWFNGDVSRCWQEKSWPRRAESLVLLGLLAAIATVVFTTPKPLLFLLYPPMMLVTFRSGRVGAKFGVTLIAVIGTIATLHGLGPVTLLSDDPAQRAQFFQAVLAVLLVTCLPVAAEVSARTRLTEELEQKTEELAERALTDPLTGVANRAGTAARAAALLGGANPQLTVVAVDVDHFKQINDHWGHQAGDRALVHLAAALRSQLRGHDLVGRLGGDEFALLLPGSDGAQAQAICDRLRLGLRRMPFTPDDDTSVMLSVSCGIAAARPGDDLAALLARADAALYAAKAAGRNAVRMTA